LHILGQLNTFLAIAAAEAKASAEAERRAQEEAAQVSKHAKLAQKLGQLQPFVDVFPPECMDQLAYFGPT
jgi:hypothetical protein